MLAMTIWEKLKYEITLNGLLLPLKNKIVYQDLSFNANYSAIFRYKIILYFNPISQKGFMVTVSRKKYFIRLFYLLLDLYKIRRQFAKQQKNYRGSIEELTSHSFWEKILLQKDNTKI